MSPPLENFLKMYETAENDYNIFTIYHYGKKYKIDQETFGDLIMKIKTTHNIDTSSIIPRPTKFTNLYFDLDDMKHDMTEFIVFAKHLLVEVFDLPDLSYYITKNENHNNYHVYFYNIIKELNTYKYICKTMNDRFYKGEEVIDMNIPTLNTTLRVDGFTFTKNAIVKGKYCGVNCELNKEFYDNTYPNRLEGELSPLDMIIENVEITKPLKNPYFIQVVKPVEREIDTLDTTIAEWFIDYYGEDIMYIKEEKCFYNYDGTYWVLDKGNHNVIELIITKFYKKIRKEIHVRYKKYDDLKDDNKVKYYSKLLGKIGCIRNNKKATDVLKILKTLLRNDNVKFDTDPYIVVFKNGVYHLTEKQFRNSRREEYVTNTKTTGYNFIPPNQENIKYLKEEYLSKIFVDEEDRKVYLIFTSTMLLGHYIKNFMICNGSGNNGKSQITGFNAKVMGDYASKLSNEMILSFTPDRAGMFKLNGLRYGYFEEPSKDRTIQGNFLKDLTGGGTIEARRIYKEDGKINICITPAICVNTKPSINPTDQAIKERIIDLEFKSKFVSKKKVDIKNRRFLGDKKMERVTWYNKYRMDYFHVLLEHLQLYTDNDGVIPLTKEMIDRRDEYLLDSDNFYSWFNENYEITENINDVMKMSSMMDDFKNSSYFRALSKTAQRKGRSLLKRELQERSLMGNYYEEKKINGKKYKCIFTCLKDKSYVECEIDSDDEN